MRRTTSLHCGKLLMKRRLTDLAIHLSRKEWLYVAVGILVYLRNPHSVFAE